jgi:ADP-heptose:LPS heptosyltransferase
VPLSAPLEWPLPAGGAPAGFVVGEPFVLLHPFSRGEGKSLTAEQVRDFCIALAPHRVVIAGRSEEHLDAISNATDLLNRTSLGELTWLIRRAAFVVSVDSGPMHIAAALTPKLLSIHTWSDPAKVGPHRPDAWVWSKGAIFRVSELDDRAAHRSCRDIRDAAVFVASQLRG